MGFVEDIKWWHWMLISLLVGAAFGYMHSEVDDTNERSVGQETFEQKLLAPSQKGNPNIKDIKVYPAMARGQLVTFKMLDEAAIDKAIKEKKTVVTDAYKECNLIAPVPYEPTGSRSIGNPGAQDKWPGTKIYIGKAGDDIKSVAKAAYGVDTPGYEHLIKYANLRLSDDHAERMKDFTIHPGQAYFIPWNPKENHTVNDFLVEAGKTKGTPIQFTYAWWHIKKYVYPFWMGSSFIIVGMIWPLLIQLLVTGGLGREKVADDGYDLSRFKGGKDPVVNKKAAVVTDDDMKKLAALEASLEASLKSSGEPKAAPQTDVKTEAPVKKLQAAGIAAPPPPPAPADPAKPKDYKGEFYPVSRGGEKKKS